MIAVTRGNRLKTLENKAFGGSENKNKMAGWIILRVFRRWIAGDSGERKKVGISRVAGIRRRFRRIDIGGNSRSEDGEEVILVWFLLVNEWRFTIK
jgi:hypothetical protein